MNTTIQYLYTNYYFIYYTIAMVYISTEENAGVTTKDTSIPATSTSTAIKSDNKPKTVLWSNNNNKPTSGAENA